MTTPTPDASVPPPGRPRPTEAEIQAALNNLFDQVEAVANAIEAGAFWPEIQKGSQMAADDRHTDPIQLSHSVQTLVNSSVEHLHALAALIRKAGLLHNSAPFTLTRSAVETAATAHWMLQPIVWRDRVKRLLSYQGQDRYDFQTVSELIQKRYGGDLPSDIENRKKIIEDLIQRHNITDMPRRLEPTNVIQEVDRQLDAKEQRREYHQRIEIFWRMASAFAHGRQWPVLNGLIRSEIKPHGDGVVRIRLESDLARVMWAASTAYEMADRAAKLYFDACSKPRR